MSDISNPETSRLSRRDFLRLAVFTAGAAGLATLPELPFPKDIYVPSLGKNGEFVHFRKGMVLNEKNELLGPFEQFANQPYLANVRVENPYLRGKQYVDVTPNSLRSESWKKYMEAVNKTAPRNQIVDTPLKPGFSDVLLSTSNYLRGNDRWLHNMLNYKGSREIDDLIGTGNTLCFEFAVAVHCAMACLGQITDIYLIKNCPHLITVFNDGVQGDMAGDAMILDSGAVPLESYKKIMCDELNLDHLELEKIKPAFKPLISLKS